MVKDRKPRTKGRARPHVKLGERIEAYRVTKGLSQRETAAAVGIPQARLSRIETGGEMPLSVFFRLCRFFSTDPNQLSGWG